MRSAVTLGAVSDPASLITTAVKLHLVWTLSSAVRTPGGAARAATPVTETGTADRVH